MHPESVSHVAVRSDSVMDRGFLRCASSQGWLLDRVLLRSGGTTFSRPSRHGDLLAGLSGAPLRARRLELGGLGQQSHDLSLGLLGLRRRGLRESTEQGGGCRYVLSRASKLRGTLAVGDDALKDIVGHYASASARAGTG